MGQTERYILKNESSETAIEISQRIKSDINIIKLSYSKIASFKHGISLEYSQPNFFISIEIDKDGGIYVLYKKLYKCSGVRKVDYIKLKSFIEKLIKIA